jgi:diguanylate cyclase (GGDEF)-like protein
MYSIACFAWGLADSLWAVMHFYGASPENSPVIWIFYALTNIILLSSLFIFAMEQFKKWDLMQNIIDLLINGFMTLLLFWILFLHKDISIFHTLMSYDFTSILSILTDILIFIGVLSWFLSIRSGKIPSFMRIIAFGLVLFSLTDIVYYYIDYNSLYTPNGLLDFIYAASLYVIAFGALWKTYKNSSVFDLSVITNTGKRMRWIYLLLYPFFGIILSSTEFIDVKLSFVDLLFFSVTIMLYWGFCKYIQLALEKEMLLKHQNRILEQRIADQVSELAFLANQDTLTALFNRRYFIAALDQSIQTKDKNDILAIMMIDLDRFKIINDIYGHDVGDQLLIEISQRMEQWNRLDATLARLGGDEFAVIFKGKYTQKDIENLCVQLINICSKPIKIEAAILNPTISIGVAMVAESIPHRKTLMKHADIAMYRAKSRGYNKYQFYNPLIDQEFKQNIEIESLLTQADVEKEFELFYQPQYSLPNLKLIGAEALIRWNNRQHGYIPPNIFIPIAEEIDYISKISRWVLQQTIGQAKKWNRDFPMLLKVGFNLSPKQFEDVEFIRTLETLIISSDLNPEYLDAEITENMMIQDGIHVRNVFKTLKKIGISISIDDFGTNYSALNYINKYPFDRIKIDKSLIYNISRNNFSDNNIVKAAIDLAHEAGIEVIAEGVENNEQLEILIDLGCDQVQGFYLGRPVPADTFEERYISKAF